MIHQEQLIKTANGDCLRSCIANLLNYKINEVPNFIEAPQIPDSPYPAWWIALQSWLAEKGLFFLEIQLVENMPWMPIPVPALCIFFGTTNAGIKHAIIGKVDQGEFIPVFNPWPEAQIDGIGGIGFLIPRDPALPINLGKTLEKVGKLVLGLPSNPVTDSIRGEVAAGLGLPGVNGHQIIIPGR